MLATHTATQQNITASPSSQPVSGKLIPIWQNWESGIPFPERTSSVGLSPSGKGQGIPFRQPPISASIPELKPINTVQGTGAQNTEMSWNEKRKKILLISSSTKNTINE